MSGDAQGKTKVVAWSIGYGAEFNSKAVVKSVFLFNWVPEQ